MTQESKTRPAQIGLSGTHSGIAASGRARGHTGLLSAGGSADQPHPQSPGHGGVSSCGDVIAGILEWLQARAMLGGSFLLPLANDRASAEAAHRLHFCFVDLQRSFDSISNGQQLKIVRARVS